MILASRFLAPALALVLALTAGTQAGAGAGEKSAGARILEDLVEPVPPVPAGEPSAPGQAILEAMQGSGLAPARTGDGGASPPRAPPASAAPPGGPGGSPGDSPAAGASPGPAEAAGSARSGAAAKTGPGGSGRVGASPKPGASPKAGSPPKRGTSSPGFHRTGEEAPIRPVDKDLIGDLPEEDTVGSYEVPLELLHRMAASPAHPMEEDMALAYLGFLGEDGYLDRLLARIEEARSTPVDCLPHLDVLVDAYGDTSYRDLLSTIVTTGGTASFQRLWALDILARMGEGGHVDVLQGIASSSSADTSERLKALQILAKLGDATQLPAAEKLSRNNDLFRETRFKAMLVMDRMKKGSATRELLQAVASDRMSLDERLAIALSMCESGVTEVKDFLKGVVDRRADSVFGQLKALHGLALIGETSRHKVLYRILETKTRSVGAAQRVLVLMGDRSRLPQIEPLAREGDLEALRTLVIARLMDDGALTAAEMIGKPRYRALVAP